MIRAFSVDVKKTQRVTCETLDEVAEVLRNAPSQVSGANSEKAVAVVSQPRRHDTQEYVIMLEWWEREDRPAVPKGA